MANNEWLDEDTEMMQIVPPEDERLACVWVRRDVDTPFGYLLGIIAVLPGFFFISGRGGPIIDLGIEGMIGSTVFALLILVFGLFLGRHEKGRVDIYPNMFVWYDYDPDRKEARPCQFYYWSDIVQYNAAEPYIWLGNKDSYPVPIFVDMAKLCPYFEQYAPHAEVVRFDMHRYFDKRLDQYNAEKKAARKAAKKAEKEQDKNID